MTMNNLAVSNTENPLDLLMRKDPLELNDNDITAAVKHLRASRADFALLEKGGKKKEKEAASPQLSLTDLGL
jgi:hypothetical protein